MKILFIFYILFLFTSCNYNNTNKKPDIEVKTTLVRSYDSIDYNSTKHKYFDIKIVITNNSSKQIKFWIMSCSWYDNFKVNNNYIGISIWECDGNYQQKVSIKPNCSKTFKCSLFKYKEISTKGPHYTKLGLIYIDSDKSTDYDDTNDNLNSKTKQEGIIWSNPLNLN